MVRRHRSTSKLPCRALIVLASLPGLLFALPLPADHGKNTISSVSRRPPSQGHHAHRGSPRHSHSHNTSGSSYGRLVSPLGSAANVRPGFYNHQLSAPHPGHSAPIYVPQVIYVETPVYSPPAPVLEPPLPAPQPIYVVSPPPAPQPSPRRAAPPDPVATPRPVSPPAPKPTGPGQVRFSIEPPDAEVYLDDDYLGTGADLAIREEALVLSPKVYVLEVSHPDHRPQRLVFGINSEDPKEVLIDLTADRVGRRSRVR